MRLKRYTHNFVSKLSKRFTSAKQLILSQIFKIFLNKQFHNFLNKLIEF